MIISLVVGVRISNQMGLAFFGIEAVAELADPVVRDRIGALRLRSQPVGSVGEAIGDLRPSFNEV